jgi:hypothetical protein
MKEPLEPPRRRLMISRSRVRLFLGHLCAKQPENPAVASRVYTHGEARAEEELSNITGGLGVSPTGRYAAVLSCASSATDVSRPERGSLCKPDEECSSTAGRRERSDAFSVPEKSPQPKTLKGSFSRTTTHTKVKQTQHTMYICPLPPFPFCFCIPDVFQSFLSFASFVVFSLSLFRIFSPLATKAQRTEQLFRKGQCNVSWPQGRFS